MKNHYNEGRVVKHVSLNLEREKHIIEWFERNKGQASVIIKQWIERELRFENGTVLGIEKTNSTVTGFDNCINCDVD